LAGSTLVSTQALPHFAVPAPQLNVQALFAQTWPAAQALPQEPQFSGSTLVSTQVVPQVVEPPVHENEQTPLAQT